MKRRLVLPGALAVTAAGAALLLCRPEPAPAWQQDSPIVVSDGNSIHFRRSASGARFQSEAAGIFVQDNGHVTNVTLPDGSSVPLNAGWTIDVRDGGAVAAHLFESGGNTVVHIDMRGNAHTLPTPNEGVQAGHHARTFVINGGTPHNCTAGSACFTVHYQIP